MTPAQLRVGSALVLLGPFVPLLFQGEEWAASSPFLYFTDHGDEALAEAVRSGRRTEFAAFVQPGSPMPDPQAPETFGRSKLDWDERRQGEHAAQLEWHRRLIALRRARADLRDGRRPDVRWDATEQWLLMRRGDVLIGASLGPRPAEVLLEAAGLRVELASDDAIALDGGSLRLPPWSVAVLVPER